MVKRTKKAAANKAVIFTADCETDPFKHGRIPTPFLWGLYDGSTFIHFTDTQTFIEHISELNCIVYMHNGGKFDFHFLYDYFNQGTIKIINSRIAELRIGKAILRDSFSIIPMPLSAYEKTKIEYWKFEKEFRNEYMDEIVSYLKDDCVYLYDLVSAYRAHVGSKITLASNAMAFSKTLDIDVGRTNLQFDTVFREFYFGGRCNAFKRGKFRDVKLCDIKSAYPYAMTFKHATGDNYRVTNIIPDNIERGQRMFFRLECHSHSAFCRRDKFGLNFPDEYGEWFVTGWELYSAIKHKLISRPKVLCAYEFYDHISFAPYIQHWFEAKEKAEKEGDKIQRMIAKLMLNSLYGKLAQNPTNFYEYKIMPRDSDLEKGWELHAEQSNWELHARSTELVRKERYRDAYDYVPQFYNVATAASITGLVRSMLLDAMANVGMENVVYCDTDSLFILGSKSVHKDAPVLGEFGLEGIAKEIYIAGKKLYAAKLTDGKEKIACKGVKLDFDDIKALANGKDIEWKSEAPSFNVMKSPVFVVRKLTGNGSRNRR
jgi:hypothetical protein